MPSQSNGSCKKVVHRCDASSQDGQFGSSRCPPSHQQVSSAKAVLLKGVDPCAKRTALGPVRLSSRWVGKREAVQWKHSTWTQLVELNNLLRSVFLSHKHPTGIRAPTASMHVAGPGTWPARLKSRGSSDDCTRDCWMLQPSAAKTKSEESP